MTVSSKSPPDQRQVGLVLVDHGSRRTSANAMVLALAAAVQQELDRSVMVRGAHMECAEPSLSQAIAECVEAGVRRVFVQPLFLVPGKHATRDIPQLVSEASEQYPNVQFEMGGVIGADPLLSQLVTRRFGAWRATGD